MAKLFSNIFGLRILSGSMETAISEITDLTENKNFSHVSIITGLRILKIRLSKKYTKIFKKADIFLPEGKSIRWVSNLLNKKVGSGFTAIDVFMNLIRDAVLKKQSIFFLGATQNSIKLAIENLKKSFPEIKIIGSHHGYFSKERNKDIVEAIRKFSPTYLFVGIGFPNQDVWIQENAKNFTSTVCLSIGNSFDLSSGVMKRAPKKFQEKGIEGLYKAWKNPIRAFRIFKYPFLLFITIWDKIFKKHK